MNHEQNLFWYNKQLKLHQCVRCTQQDARTLIGKPLCFDCLELKRTENKAYDQSKSQAKSKQKAIDSGLCTHCRKRKAPDGYKTCAYCRAKQKAIRDAKRAESNRIRRDEANSYGLCSHCLKEPVYEDYGVCYKCYTWMQNKFKANTHKRWKDKIKLDVERNTYV